MTLPNTSDPVLCFVRGSWCWFTQLALEDQWGDDWNDAPYEHNAGTPYQDEPNVFSIAAIDACFSTPDSGYLNSPNSVEDINIRKRVPWLRADVGNDSADIWAGTPISQFTRIIEDSGGLIAFTKGA
jgi:hypothetical protein